MIILVRFIGFVMVVMGTAIVLNPKIFKAVVNFWRQGKNIYLAGVIRLIFGAIFLTASPACRFPLVISVFGVLMVIGGIMIFMIGQKRIQLIFDWWERRPLITIRLMGLVPLALGSLVLFSI